MTDLINNRIVNIEHIIDFGLTVNMNVLNVIEQRDSLEELRFEWHQLIASLPYEQNLL